MPFGKLLAHFYYRHIKMSYQIGAITGIDIDIVGIVRDFIIKAMDKYGFYRFQ